MSSFLRRFKLNYICNERLSSMEFRRLFAEKNSLKRRLMLRRMVDVTGFVVLLLLF